MLPTANRVAAEFTCHDPIFSRSVPIALALVGSGAPGPLAVASQSNPLVSIAIAPRIPSPARQTRPNIASSLSSSRVIPYSVTARVIAQKTLHKSRNIIRRMSPAWRATLASRAGTSAPSVTRPNITIDGNATPI